MRRWKDILQNQAASETEAAVAVCAANHWEKATCAESERVWSAVEFSITS